MRSTCIAKGLVFLATIGAVAAPEAETQVIPRQEIDCDWCRDCVDEYFLEYSHGFIGDCRVYGLIDLGSSLVYCGDNCEIAEEALDALLEAIERDDFLIAARTALTLGLRVRIRPGDSWMEVTACDGTRQILLPTQNIVPLVLAGIDSPF